MATAGECRRFILKGSNVVSAASARLWLGQDRVWGRGTRFRRPCIVVEIERGKEGFSSRCGVRRGESGKLSGLPQQTPTCSVIRAFTKRISFPGAEDFANEG